MSRSNLPWLTFDCYDTLVRYTESKAEALANLVKKKGGSEKLIRRAQAAFETTEKELQIGDFVMLTEVLRLSVRAGLRTAELETTTADEDAIIDAVKKAIPFPDTRPVLDDLRRDYRIAILSNSEPDVIQYNIANIGVEFDEIVLAAEVKCYKPDRRMFDELLVRINERPENVTHIAQSFYHDIRPARDIGFGRRLWINRYNRQGDPAYKPDVELPNMLKIRSLLN